MMKLQEIFIMQESDESESVHFFRRLINSVLNNSTYLNDQHELEFQKHENEIIDYLVSEFQKYNYDQDVYIEIIEVMEKLFQLIEKKKIDVTAMKGYNDVAFLQVWKKIAKKLKNVQDEKTKGSNKFIEKNKKTTLLK